MANEIPDLGYVKVQVFCYDLANLQVGINTFYLQQLSHTGAATDANLAAALYAALIGLYTHVLSNDAEFSGLQVQYLTTPAVTPAAAVPVGVMSGTAANGGPIPDVVSGLIGARGFLAQKGQSARMYIPFPGTAFLTSSGNPTPAYLAGLLSISNVCYTLQTWIGSGYTIQTSPVIFHRAQPARVSKSKRKNAGKTLPATGQAFFSIATNYAGVLFARMKRRAARSRANAQPILPT